MNGSLTIARTFWLKVESFKGYCRMRMEEGYASKSRSLRAWLSGGGWMEGGDDKVVRWKRKEVGWIVVSKSNERVRLNERQEAKEKEVKKSEVRSEN